MSENLPAVRPQVSAGGSVGALVPQTIDEAWRLSEAFAKAKILPRGITEPAQVMLVICGGAEVGFGPFQSLQSFYLVNNRLTLWGDAIPALLWTHGFKIKEWYENADPAYPENMVAKCIVTRPDGQEIEGEFSVADAKEGKLWTKEGPWQTSKKRMLKMRARAFAARDGAPDVLRGVGIREEVEDYATITEVTTLPQPMHSGMKDDATKTTRSTRKKTDAQPEGISPAATEGADTQAATEPHDPVTGEILDAREDKVIQTMLDGDDLPEGLRHARDVSAEELQARTQAMQEAKSAQSDQDGKTAPEPEGDTIKVGFPANDEVYHIASDNGPTEERRNTYKNGELFSTAARSKGLPIYAEHAPAAQEKTEEAQSPADPEPTNSAQADEETFPPEFEAYIEKTEASGSWAEIKAAMAEFYTTALFKSWTPAQQNKVRASTYEIAKENCSDLPDHATDVSVFRLWIEWVEDADAIEGTLSVLEKSESWKSAPDATRNVVMSAAAASMAALRS